MGKMTSKPIRLGRSCPKSVRGGAARIPKPNRVYNFNNFYRNGCNVQYSYEAGSAYRTQPHLRSNARAVDRSIAVKIRYSDSDGPRGPCMRSSIPRVGHISRQFHGTSSRSPKHATDPAHREVRPSKAPPARSPRRVRARRRGQFAFKMRFCITNPWINRSWVNCDQVSFWFQKQKGSPFKFIISR